MKVQYVFVLGYIFFFLVPAALSADDYYVQWADTIDNGDWDGASDVAVDQSCNIVVVGSSFIGGNTDYFIVKYDSGGMILWADTLDNGNEDYAQAVAVDDNNNIIMTGYCMINGDYDFCTVKYDPAGTILWQEILDNNGQFDIARGVAVDNGQNIVVAGYCDIDGDCVYLTVKYDASGTIIWIDTLAYGFYDTALDIAVDNANNIIVTGYTTTSSNNDYFTVKYDSSGIILWQETIDICQYDQAYGVAADNSKNIIVTGCSGEAIDDYDFFTVKYDSGGTILWADTVDYENTDDVAYDITVDNDNNIYITGYVLRLSGDYNFFTVKYDSTGTILWQGIYDNSDQDIAYGIAVDELNNIVLTGRSYIAGSFDHFTVKYVPIPGIFEYSRQDFNYPMIEVSPNPFHNKISFVLRKDNLEAIAANSQLFRPNLSIYNVTGRLAKQWDYQTIQRSDEIIWDGTDDTGNRLSSGVYYLMIEIEKYRATKKLLLIR